MLSGIFCLIISEILLESYFKKSIVSIHDLLGVEARGHGLQRLIPQL